jgi:hypothetical protein
MIKGAQRKLAKFARYSGVGLLQCRLRAGGRADPHRKRSASSAKSRPVHGDRNVTSGGVSSRRCDVFDRYNRRCYINASGEQQSRKDVGAATNSWPVAHCATLHHALRVALELFVDRAESRRLIFSFSGIASSHYRRGAGSSAWEARVAGGKEMEIYKEGGMQQRGKQSGGLQTPSLEVEAFHWHA